MSYTRGHESYPRPLALCILSIIGSLTKASIDKKLRPTWKGHFKDDLLQHCYQTLSAPLIDSILQQFFEWDEWKTLMCTINNLVWNNTTKTRYIHYGHHHCIYYITITLLELRLCLSAPSAGGWTGWPAEKAQRNWRWTGQIHWSFEKCPGETGALRDDSFRCK